MVSTPLIWWHDVLIADNVYERCLMDTSWSGNDGIFVGWVCGLRAPSWRFQISNWFDVSCAVSFVLWCLIHCDRLLWLTLFEYCAGQYNFKAMSDANPILGAMSQHCSWITFYAACRSNIHDILHAFGLLATHGNPDDLSNYCSNAWSLHLR